MTEKEPKYPWLRLLELELEEAPRPVSRRRPGRPRSAFSRKRVRSSLTEDEKAALDGLVDFLSEHMGKALHRGHLIAFMTFRLRTQLEKDGELSISEDIDSFRALSKYLDSRER